MDKFDGQISYSQPTCYTEQDQQPMKKKRKFFLGKCPVPFEKFINGCVGCNCSKCQKTLENPDEQQRYISDTNIIWTEARRYDSLTRMTTLYSVERVAELWDEMENSM